MVPVDAGLIGISLGVAEVAPDTEGVTDACMLTDWYRPGVTLDFPHGGSGAIVDTLVHGVHEKADSKVCLNSHVDEIPVEDGKAAGVHPSSGKVPEARGMKVVRSVLATRPHQLRGCTFSLLVQ